MQTCPCQSQQPYENCCQPYHEQSKQPKTAEQLMRSRYAAYVLQQIDYIIKTTVPAQQALLDQTSITQWSYNAQWLGLTVHQHITNIHPHHAQVAFTVYFMEHGKSYNMMNYQRLYKFQVTGISLAQLCHCPA